MYTDVYNSIIANSKKVETAQCPWRVGWINKTWFIHIVEYYSAIKRREVVTEATAWMNLENVVPCEISQTPKAGYYMVPELVNT